MAQNDGAETADYGHQMTQASLAIAVQALRDVVDQSNCHRARHIAKGALIRVAHEQG